MRKLAPSLQDNIQPWCQFFQAEEAQGRDGRRNWSARMFNFFFRFRDVKYRKLTVAKKSFPSSLPTPSRTLSKPERVTADLARLIAELTVPNWLAGEVSSSSSRDGNAQSMSSMRRIEFFGMDEAALWRKVSSILKGYCVNGP